MKNYRTPRTLAETEFTTDYPRFSPRVERGLDIVVAIALGVAIGSFLILVL